MKTEYQAFLAQPTFDDSNCSNAPQTNLLIRALESLSTDVAVPFVEQAVGLPVDGWLIAEKQGDGKRSGKYLQIGTGQWGPLSYATLFPLRSTAMIYAHEFGYCIGHTADVVPSRST